ncbi:MAG: helix-turn-helix domain-containing protein [Clostridia bacterium]|nr:helix-turn-helix domain-containing protein [Clostridia bacterium]
MAIDIGSKIRQLRRHNGVTQEVLGEYLGLTAQAVSRWESGICCPDIELLPGLAEFFGVTTDELLGIDRTKSPQKIKEYLSTAEKLSELGKFGEIIALMRGALEQYPNSAELRLALAEALVSDESGTGVNEACEICRLLLKNPRNTERQRGEARRILCIAYTFRLKNEEKTQEVINDMADWNYSRELFAARYLTGKKAHEQMTANLKWLVDNVWNVMMNLFSLDDNFVSNQYSPHDKILIAEKSISLLELVFDNNYMYYGTRVCASYMLLARLHAMYGDKSKVTDCIEKAVIYAMEYDRRPEKGSYKCILLRDVPYVKHQWRENRGHTECWYILKQLSDSVFDIVRGDDKMEEIYIKLKRTVDENEKNII